MRNLLLFFYISFSTFCSVSAQEMPPIQYFTPISYGGGNQNWMISQDQNQYLYFANNQGLLSFDGAKWEIYPSINESIVRSVKVIGERIYTGCYMDFGYWTRMKNGRLLYTSLSAKIKSKIQEDEQFWNILHFDQWVVFQSLNKIFIYDAKKESFKIIAPKSPILKSFLTANTIFYQTVDSGLYEIVRGQGSLVSNDPVLKNNKIVNLFSSDGGLFIQTQSKGVFTLIDGKIQRFVTDIDDALQNVAVYNSLQLANGNFAIGTVSNGVYIINEKGKLLHHLYQGKGLSNNTVLSLYEDKDANLWIGLDNGINCINLQSPIKSFVDISGKLGTVYATKLYQGMLYIGTNQGLFYKQFETNDDFTLVQGTKGQVWSLFDYQGDLFCGHDMGTFLVKGGSVKSIFNQSGTWKFSTLPNRKDILIQGNYYGLSVLQKVNNQWGFRNKIKGFNNSAKSFEITNGREVYVNHEYKGIFRLFLDNALTQTKPVYTYSYPKKGINSGLVKFNGVIYYAYKGGVFKLNAKTRNFEKDAFLSAIFEKDQYKTGQMVVDKANRLWMFTQNSIHYITESKLSNQYKDNSIPITASLANAMLGYENCTQVGKSKILIGTSNGYFTVNFKEIEDVNYSVNITRVGVSRLDEKTVFFPIEGNDKFDAKQNNITINFTVPEFNKFITPKYQYQLEGFQEQWSSWNERPSVFYKNVPPGDYTFKVRARFSNHVLANVGTYSFTILKPWYATHFANFIYLVLFGILIYYTHQAYQRAYEKKQAKLIEENNRLLEIQELENQQELMRLRNEQLVQDVDIKNRELAVSTMSLHNKNELLAFIKEDLKKTAQNESSTSKIKSVISTINKNITSEDSWKVFQEAFDSVDKDFLKRIKQLHPNLTANDLRLCAYLRMNLSSKEIAPLLNISVRSIEIKRYRLRKKLDLEHEKGLVEYILLV